MEVKFYESEDLLGLEKKVNDAIKNAKSHEVNNIVFSYHQPTETANELYIVMIVFDC
ncbi:hypothetical protein ACFTQ7_21905 [Lysinibacillus sp. NPDC056959]|uniref:hypothetical protein n=1 Tax=Lysinibacillus sp. NPDC056959 TaxID=3345981 RepID=UPI0036331ED5